MSVAKMQLKEGKLIKAMTCTCKEQLSAQDVYGTHEMTVLRKRRNCSVLRFLTKLHCGFCRMWKATEQWWFSSGDTSL